MNRQIIRLTYVALGARRRARRHDDVLADVGRAPSSPARQDNAIRRVAEFSIDRGLIFSFAPRKRLARNREREIDGKTLFFRRYPYGPLAAHVVGYSTVGRSRTGLERSLNDYLTASNANLSTVARQGRSTSSAASRSRATTSSRRSTSTRRRSRTSELGTNCGAVVALDPRTGKVLVDGVVARASIRTSSRRTSTGSQTITANCTPAAPLAQPRERRPLRPRLDVQGHHGVGGARVEEVHARSRRSSTPATAPSTGSA